MSASDCDITVEDFSEHKYGQVNVLRAGRLLVALDNAGRFVTCAVFGLGTPAACQKVVVPRKPPRRYGVVDQLIYDLVRSGLSFSEVNRRVGVKSVVRVRQRYEKFVKKLGALPSS